MRKFAQNTLKPLARFGEERPYVVFDIETAPQDKQGRYPDGWREGDLNQFFLGAGIFDGVDYVLVDESEGAEVLFWELLSRKENLVLAHNGSKFDAKFLLGPLAKSGLPWSAAQAGSRMWLTIEYEGEKKYVHDSAAILPASLARLSAYYNIAHKKLDWHEEDYRNIRNRPWREYLEQDCRALYEVVALAREEITSLGGRMGRSTASSAMSIFRARFLKQEIHSEPLAEAREREALYGGRCQVFRSEAEECSVWDINSSYSCSALEPLPVQYLRTVKRTKNLESAICHATIDIPPGKVGAIPVRNEGRLTFPTDRIVSGWWCGPELIEARELYGNRAVKIHEAMIYRMKPFLKDYASTLYKAKLEGSPSAKLLLNGLYGRFGLKRERQKLVGPVVSPSIPARYYAQGRWPVELNSYYHIWAIPDDARSFAFPAIFAWITSLGRVRLLRGFLANEDRLLYGDTDSMILSGLSTPSAVEVGPGLGAWKWEGSFRDFSCLAPKLYAMTDIESGKPKVRGKGMRNFSYEQYLQAARGVPVRTAQLQGLRTVMRSGQAPQVVERYKKARKGNGKTSGRRKRK